MGTVGGSGVVEEGLLKTVNGVTFDPLDKIPCLVNICLAAGRFKFNLNTLFVVPMLGGILFREHFFSISKLGSDTV